MSTRLRASKAPARTPPEYRALFWVMVAAVVGAPLPLFGTLSSTGCLAAGQQQCTPTWIFPTLAASLLATVGVLAGFRAAKAARAAMRRADANAAPRHAAVAGAALFVAMSSVAGWAMALGAQVRWQFEATHTGSWADIGAGLEALEAGFALCVLLFVALPLLLGCVAAAAAAWRLRTSAPQS